MFVEEVGLEIIDAEFKGSKALTHEGLGSIQGWHERIHEHRQVGQKRRQPDRNGEAELDKEILHVLLVEPRLEDVEDLKKVWKQRQEFLEEKIHPLDRKTAVVFFYSKTVLLH